MEKVYTEDTAVPTLGTTVILGDYALHCVDRRACVLEIIFCLKVRVIQTAKINGFLNICVC